MAGKSGSDKSPSLDHKELVGIVRTSVKPREEVFGLFSCPISSRRKNLSFPIEGRLIRSRMQINSACGFNVFMTYVFN